MVAVDGFIIGKATDWNGDSRIIVLESQTRAPLFMFRKTYHVAWANDYAAYRIGDHDQNTVALREFKPESKITDSRMTDPDLELYARLFKLGGLNVFCANDNDYVCDGTHHRNNEDYGDDRIRLSGKVEWQFKDETNPVSQ